MSECILCTRDSPSNKFLKCSLSGNNFLPKRRKNRILHDCNDGEGLHESRMAKAGRTLRTIKHRKAVEDVQSKKQLFTLEIKKLLKEWLVRRRKHPYPSRSEKKELAIQTGLTYMQICNWFANWRRKLRKNSTGEGWGRLITGYNRQAQERGNCEQISISSRDSIWDEANYNLPQSESDLESSQTSRAIDRTIDRINERDQHLDNDKWLPEFEATLTPERATPSVLVKWLESAARFRPRDVCWSSTLNCWGGCPPLATRKPRRPRGRLRTSGKSRRRHREELDAAEALTFLSLSTIQSQPVVN